MDLQPSTASAHNSFLEALTDAGLDKNDVRVAEHLGGRHELEMRNTAEVRYRIACSNVGWCAHRALWGDLKVTRERRLLVFKSVVYTRLTAGLEVLCLTTSELKKLEASVMKKLRRILCGEGKGMTNSWIRTQCKSAYSNIISPMSSFEAFYLNPENDWKRFHS